MIGGELEDVWRQLVSIVLFRRRGVGGEIGSSSGDCRGVLWLGCLSGVIRGASATCLILFFQRLQRMYILNDFDCWPKRR